MTATDFKRWDQNPVIYLGNGPRRWEYWPRRSSLTEVVNRIVAIRQNHNQAFQYDAGYDGGEFSGPAHRRTEDREHAQVLADTGWTWGTLEREVEQRTTKRWARYVRWGWL